MEKRGGFARTRGWRRQTILPDKLLGLALVLLLLAGVLLWIGYCPVWFFGR